MAQFFDAGSNSEWYIPRTYADAARSVMGCIDLDPASCAEANETVGAACYYSRGKDGLSRPWFGRVWLNQPTSDYRGQAGDWADKLHEEYVSHRVSQAIMVTNMNFVYQSAFQRILRLEIAICITDRRIAYMEPGGAASRSNTQSQIFYYLGNYRTKFEEIFRQFGAILWAGPPTRPLMARANRGRIESLAPKKL